MANERVALVTGASSGFGMLTATMLLKKGLRVFGTSRMPKERSVNGFEMLQLDIDSDQSVKSCVSEVITRAGRVDVLVNNAGYAFSGSVEETSIDEAKALLETNFYGAVRMTNAVLPDMRHRKSGQIVNVGSWRGHSLSRSTDSTLPPRLGFWRTLKSFATRSWRSTSKSQ